MTHDAQPLYPEAVPSPHGPARTYGPMNAHGLPAVALVLHTTETAGLPYFRGGAVAPHYVYEPDSRRWTRWAEYEDGYVGTMRGHTRGGHANCKALQVEIVGYSNYTASLQAGRPDLWVGHFTGSELVDLASFVRWARERYGITEELHGPPRGDSWRYGTDSKSRLSDSAWASFGGLTAHGGVPRQTHWDTGILNLAAIDTYAREGGIVLRDLITDATWAAYAAAVGPSFGDARYYMTNDGTYELSPPWGEGADDGGADNEPGARTNAYNVAQQALARGGRT